MSVVDAQRRDDVLVLTLDRPAKHNALDIELVEEMLHHVEQAYSDPPDLFVVRAHGPSFSAGFDLGGLATTDDATLLHRFVRIEQLLQALHHAPFATLALAHGRVFGAGADIVVACEQRIAAPGTMFRLPGLAFGIVLGTRRLALRVGVDAARAIQAGGRTVDAEQAVELGLITDVAAQHEWDDAMAGAAQLARDVPVGARPIFHRAVAPGDGDVELAELVRSAVVPGLVARIRSYAVGVNR